MEMLIETALILKAIELFNLKTARCILQKPNEHTMLKNISWISWNQQEWCQISQAIS
jgi:hypothetical protein